ncbi:MAG: hypothetical protein HY901_18190 [Deltaproteobacteria bacterium]|nr:hypothetical protein [Deltaproteobacteria bacterium]
MQTAIRRKSPWKPWVVGACMLSAAQAQAQPHPWPFDFDPQIAADPAGIQSRLVDLGEDVPPIPSGDLVRTAVGPVALYFHADMLELLQRAFASGPGFQAYFLRTPALCAQHAAFVFPTGLLVSGASSACRQTEQQLRIALTDDRQSCLRIEFPELYIDDQPPGEVDHDDLKNLEGLIRTVGEALTHIDYPSHLLPDDFEQDTRVIIAKIRYQTLLDNARARRTAYGGARQQLQANPSCFVAASQQVLLTQIAALLAELDAVEQRLQDIYAAGVAQATADRQALLAQGRARNELPYPALTDHERELLALYIGGIYWRMRGEALLAYPDSGLLRRLIYVQYPYQVIADITGAADGAGLGRDIFVHETWGYADWMDIGHNPGNDKYSDMVDMAIRGKRTLDLAAPHLAGRGYDTAYLYAGGLQMGPCYYYGWDPLWDGSPPRRFQLGPVMADPYIWFLECPTSHGEFCTGAALGLGLARTLLHGTPGGECLPSCTGLECGADGCGGSCGACDSGEDCMQGHCEAQATDAGEVGDVGEDATGGVDRVSTSDGSPGSPDTASMDATEPDSGAGDSADADAATALHADSGESQDRESVGSGGCGCSSTGSGTASGLMSLALATTLLRRRRGDGDSTHGAIPAPEKVDGLPASRPSREAAVRSWLELPGR